LFLFIANCLIAKIIFLVKQRRRKFDEIEEWRLYVCVNENAAITLITTEAAELLLQRAPLYSAFWFVSLTAQLVLVREKPRAQFVSSIICIIFLVNKINVFFFWQNIYKKWINGLI
jgi:hypothetical protein